MGGLKKNVPFALFLLIHIGLSSHKEHLATVDVKVNVRMNAGAACFIALVGAFPKKWFSRITERNMTSIICSPKYFEDIQ
jgi:hypothetical protein